MNNVYVRVFVYTISSLIVILVFVALKTGTIAISDIIMRIIIENGLAFLFGYFIFFKMLHKQLNKFISVIFSLLAGFIGWVIGGAILYKFTSLFCSSWDCFVDAMTGVLSIAIATIVLTYTALKTDYKN